MNRVLLLEDSEEFQLLVKRALASANIELVVLSSCTDNFNFIKANGARFDLAILDLVLPDGDGFSVLEALRLAGMPSRSPIFFLTSQSELNTKVTAFNLGADDYLIKPISPLELRARVEMRLRKVNAAPLDEIIRRNLVVDTKKYRALRIDNDLRTDLLLTAKEFKILSCLIQNENQVLSRATVIQSVWGDDVHILDRTVDSHVYGMRKKMGIIASYVDCILGVGYSFRLPEIDLKVG